MRSGLPSWTPISAAVASQASSASHGSPVPNGRMRLPCSSRARIAAGMTTSSSRKESSSYSGWKIPAGISFWLW